MKSRNASKMEFVVLYRDRYGRNQIATFTRITGETNGFWSQPFPKDEGQWAFDQNFRTGDGEVWSGWVTDKDGRHTMSLVFGKK